MSVPLRHLSTRRLGTIAIENTLFAFFLWAATNLAAAFSRDLPKASLLACRLFILAVVFQFFLYLRDVYDFDKTVSYGVLARRLSQAILLLAGTIAILDFLFADSFLGHLTLVTGLSLIPLVSVFWHT